MSVDPRRTQPFCTPECEERCCRCSRWPLYKNRFGIYVCAQDEEDTWSPADPLPVSGLLPEHWYISDQDLWQDAARTIPAAADGDVVGNWGDITANADHVSQAAAASKPTLQNGAGDLLNGHPVIRFDGTNDYLQGAFTNGGVMSQPNIIFVVAALDAASINDDVNKVMCDGDDGAARNMLLKSITLDPDPWAMYGGSIQNSAIAASSNWIIWNGLFNGATSQVWHNGTSIIGPADAGAHNLDGLTLGANNTVTAFWDGDIAEYLNYDANLSNADKNTVGQYLATRYGLAYTDI